MTENVVRTVKRCPITAADCAALHKKQNGVCLICVSRPATDLDHNHATGAARALLCDGCNVMLGKRNDDATLLRRLARVRRASTRGIRSLLIAERYERAALYLDVFGPAPRRAAA